MTHVTCRLTVKNRDQLRNPTLGNRVWATFTFFTSRDAGEKKTNVSKQFMQGQSAKVESVLT